MSIKMCFPFVMLFNRQLSISPPAPAGKEVVEVMEELPSRAGSSSTYQIPALRACSLRVIPARARYARYDSISAAHFLKNFLHSAFMYATIIPVEAKTIVNSQSSIVNPPRGITVEEAAQLLRYSTSTVRRLIAAHILVAWKPGGPAGRKYLIDEISLARWQAESIRRAREEASTTQAALLQGELPLVW